MIDRIVGSGLRYRGVVVVVAAGTIGFGVWQARSPRMDALPEFTPPTVQVQTEALGLSAPEVEQLITVPLEQDLLAGVPWLDTMRSESIPGLSSIELIFDPGTDVLRARQVVQERLTQAAGLPNVSSTPQMLQPLASTSRILMVRLSSGTVSPIEMSVLARWTIRPKILGVPGIANVSIWGQRERQLQVRVDPVRLRSHGISLQEMIETTGNALWASPLTFLEASTPGTGGFIDTANQRLGIQHLQPITTAADLARVPVDGGNGRTLRLGDVADVVEAHQPLIGDAVFTDGDPGLLLVVQKFPGANTLEVTRGVEAALDALRPGLSGIHVDPTIYRPATYVENGLRNLGTALLVGVLLLTLALGAFASTWRSVVVELVSILSSLLAAWVVLDLRGVSIDMMMLAGLLMALVVAIDDAIDDTGNVVRRLRQMRMNGLEPPAAKTVLAAVIEIRGPMVYATMISIIALVPPLFLQGEAAPFIPSIVLSYGLAIVASMIVALVLTPALSLLLLPRAPIERHESLLAPWLRRGYDRLLSGAIRSPRRTSLAAGAIVVVGLAALPFLRSSPLPSFRDGDVLIDWNAPPGTSLPEMDRITTRAGRELAALPGVRDVGAHVGRAVTSDQVVGIEAGQLWVSIDPAADYDSTLGAIRRVVGGYPGIDHTVRTYSDERIAEIGSDDGRPLDLRIFGQDLGVLHEKGVAVAHAMSGIDGIVRPSVELQPMEPTIDVAVDLRKADRYGIVPGDVRRSAATLLSGIGVGSLFEQQKVFDVVVWGSPDTRNSLTSVRGLLIDTPDGGHVRLAKVADVAIAPTPTVIRHRDISRSIDVTADVQGRDIGSVAAEVQDRLGSIRFPLEYHTELVGDVAGRHAAHERAIAVAIAAAILIFLLLQAFSGSWRVATLSLVALPLALVGSVLAVWAGGGVLSLGSVAGCVAVLAISARSTVALIGRYRRLEREDGIALDAVLVRLGARDRVEPMVATTLAAGLALAPLALSGGAAGEEIVQPMAIAIIGGLAASTLLNLFVLPLLYLRFATVAGRTEHTPPDVHEPPDVIVVPEVEGVLGP